MGPGLVLLAAIGGAALVRAIGARRVARGDRRFVGVTLLATLVLAVLLVIVAIWAAARSLLLGVPVLAGALILGGSWLRVSLDQARYAGAPDRPRDGMDVLVERLGVAYRSVAGWLLGAGFVAAVAFVIWLLFRRMF
jgi:hypothetical protein